jgi:UDP-2-acetamido-2,6-beta-L-arabino-hexul-4-ose reductase
MINIGVTGANGFIGQHLCNFLSLDKTSYSLVYFSRDWFYSDTLLDDFVSKCDVIIHLAGVNRHESDEFIYETNIKIAEKLIASFSRTLYNGTLLFSSSIQEERNNVFGNSKKIARQLLSNWSKENGIKFKGLLIPNVFGPFGVPFYNSVVSTFCHQIINNETPKIESDAILNLIYINDLIEIIKKHIIDNAEGKIFIEHTVSVKVSDILTLLLNFHSLYFQNGQIPNFNNAFELNLFNTYRSFLNYEGYFPKKYKKNIDERGNFVEIIRLETGGQISFSTTKKGVTRGNHFHTRKIERFSVIKGMALIQLRKIGTDNTINFYLSGDDPAYVDMPIWYTHNIKNVGEEDLYTIFWINEFYDASDPDTYFEKV